MRYINRLFTYLLTVCPPYLGCTRGGEHKSPHSFILKVSLSDNRVQLFFISSGALKRRAIEKLRHVLGHSLS